MQQLQSKQELILNFPFKLTNGTLGEILHGLQKEQKELPPKLFYDKRGSDLFDQICRLEEYYPTRTETSILQENIREIVNLIGPNPLLIEYGSGSSKKTRILLDNLPEMNTYIPVDISREHLDKTTEGLRRIYPGLEVSPICADYTSDFELPRINKEYSHKLAYFPGSTIGNFYPEEAITFMQNIAHQVGTGGGLLIGVDLQKDPGVLYRAYNDSQGVTAAFNLNMLTHINREFGADFDEEMFIHEAFYNEVAGRIEMHLVSLSDQKIHISGRNFYFRENETILTEVSYKYTLECLEQLANYAGFEVQKVWTDPRNYFSVQYLTLL